MTGRAFIRLITKRGIPLSCIATKLNCKLATLRAVEHMDSVPKHYLQTFMQTFKDSLTASDMDLLSQ